MNNQVKRPIVPRIPFFPYRLLLFTILFVTFPPIVGQAVIMPKLYYVNDTSGNDNYNCSDIETPCKTVEAALDKASFFVVDTIQIAAGTYTESLTINKDITIAGASRESVFLDGGASHRVILTHPGVTATLSKLTVQNGKMLSNWGGGIYNMGELTLTDVHIKDCEALIGGGVVNLGPRLSITDSMISNNKATSEHGGGLANRYDSPEVVPVVLLKNVAIFNNTSTNTGGMGGGIHNGGSNSLMVLTNVTISGNSSNAGAGGIFNTNSARTRLINVTVANNISGSDAGGIINDAEIEFYNTIIADNSGDNCSSSTPFWFSFGNNLSSDNSCNKLNALSDMHNTDPKLGSLADNGGNTMTHALAKDSPALDAGNNTNCLNYDQRRQIRPYDGDRDGNAQCDIGAFELKLNSFLLYLPAIIIPRE